MLRFIPITLWRVVAWFLAGAAVLPAVLGGCLVFGLLNSNNPQEVMDSLPWTAFALASLALGTVLAVLSVQQTMEDNRKWQAFFNPERIANWQEQGFQHDSKGLHGSISGIPVSIHFELDARSEYAKAVIYAQVSEEVEDLRELGREMGNSWFFLFTSYERIFDSPFSDARIREAIEEALAFGRERNFLFYESNPHLA